MNELLSVYQGRLEDCKKNIPRGARKQNLPSSNMDALPDKKVGLLIGAVQGRGHLGGQIGHSKCVLIEKR